MNHRQNNRFTYSYDALDRRAVMTDSFGGNTAYAYDPVDCLLEVTTPQGETYRNAYDLARRNSAFSRLTSAASADPADVSDSPPYRFTQS